MIVTIKLYPYRGILQKVRQQQEDVLKDFAETECLAAFIATADNDKTDRAATDDIVIDSTKNAVLDALCFCKAALL